jgi:O-antigen/teichoic acid export membrane protein
LFPFVVTAAIFLESRSAEIFGLIAVYAATFALCSNAAAGLRVRGDALGYAVVDIGRSAATFGGGLALALAGYGYAGPILAGVVASMSLAVFGFLRMGVMPSRLIARASVARDFLVYGGPLALAGGAGILLAMSSRYVVIDAIDLAAAGYFIAAATICDRTIRMLMTNLGSTFAPTIFSTHEGGDTARFDLLMGRFFAILCLVGLPLALVFGVSGPIMARVMVGEAMAESAARHLPLLAAASFLFGLQQCYFSFYFSISRRTLLQAVTYVPAIAVNVLTCYMSIAQFGEIGASIGTLAGATVGLLVTIVVGRGHAMLPIPLAAAARVGVATLAGLPLMLIANATTDFAVGVALLLTAAATIGVAAISVDAAGARRAAVAALASLRRGDARR